MDLGYRWREIDEKVVRFFVQMKQKYKAKSMDETIRKLIEAENLPESLFGAHPEMTSFSTADEAETHEI